MKALEFQASVGPDGTLKIPPEVAAQVRPEQPVRVILLVPEPSEEEAWARFTADQFVKGYAESDAIYDDLSTG